MRTAAGSVVRKGGRGKATCGFCELVVPQSQCVKYQEHCLCNECVEFADESGYEPKVLATMKNKAPGKWKEKKANKE
eukprot:6783970-Pyramimonas_sp.AAC.1